MNPEPECVVTVADVACATHLVAVDGSYRKHHSGGVAAYGVSRSDGSSQAVQLPNANGNQAAERAAMINELTRMMSTPTSGHTLLVSDSLPLCDPLAVGDVETWVKRARVKSDNPILAWLFTSLTSGALSVRWVRGHQPYEEGNLRDPYTLHHYADQLAYRCGRDTLADRCQMESSVVATFAG